MSASLRLVSIPDEVYSNEPIDDLIEDVARKAESNQTYGWIRAPESSQGYRFTPIPGVLQPILTSIGERHGYDPDRIELVVLETGPADYFAEYQISRHFDGNDYTLGIVTLRGGVVGLTQSPRRFIDPSLADDRIPDLPNLADLEKTALRLQEGRLLLIPEWIKRKFTVSLHAEDAPTAFLRLVRLRPELGADDGVGDLGVPAPFDVVGLDGSGGADT